MNNRQRLHNIESTSLPKFTLRQVRQIPDLAESDRARFWAKVRLGPPNGCWLWTGAGVPNGHGFLALGKRPTIQPFYAHRIAWVLAHGAIPDGVAVLHSCDVCRCVNPAHLFLGSQGDNVRDASQKGRLHVPRPNHPRRKLTDAQVEEIRMLASGGLPQVRLAERFDVSRACISQLVAGIRRVYTAPHLAHHQKASGF